MISFPEWRKNTKKQPIIPKWGRRTFLRGTTRNSPFGALSVPTHLRPLTESTGKPYFSFRPQLLGESPVLHASGSHHPALSVCAYQYKTTQSSPLNIFLNISIYGMKMQALFRILDERVYACYHDSIMIARCGNMEMLELDQKKEDE